MARPCDCGGGSDGVLIAKVDADAEKELAGRFEVRGFPTLKWFPAGSTEPEDYSGGREAADFVEFINGKTGESARGCGHVPARSAPALPHCCPAASNLTCTRGLAGALQA